MTKKYYFIQENTMQEFADIMPFNPLNYAKTRGEIYSFYTVLFCIKCTFRHSITLLVFPILKLSYKSTIYILFTEIYDFTYTCCSDMLYCYLFIETSVVKVYICQHFSRFSFFFLKWICKCKHKVLNRACVYSNVYWMFCTY